MEPLQTPEVASPDEVDFLEPQQLKCPWKSYEVLREQAPVWVDPRTGYYVVSRYEDIRRVLLDPDTFTSDLSEGDDLSRPEIRQMYEEKGWVPGTGLVGLDNPLHRIVRNLMEHAFRPARVRQMDGFVESLAHKLIDKWIDDGKVDLATEYSLPLPLYVMTNQMGVPDEDAMQVRAWTDAWIARISMKMTPEEEIWSAQQEIDAQHYFHAIFERVRENPEENLISDIVNGVVPEWGTGLSEEQLHVEVLVDMFTGGVQTSGHGITSGVKILIEQPEVLKKLMGDPEKYLEPFVEEVVRYDGPQQGDPRKAAVDVEIAGVTIPAGAIVHPRWGAGNRDPRRYGDMAEKIDLDRARPRTHLGFGLGRHHCIGAPLARREMYFGFKALLERIDNMEMLDDPNELQYAENYIVRGIEHFNISFDRKQ